MVRPSRLLSRRWPAVTPRRFRLATGLAVWALAANIVSGAAVRLTGSGLGCPDWPTCSANRVVAPWQFHAWVEFGNRLVVAALSVAVVVAVVAAWLRTPRRRDLTWLSWGLVAGLVVEIALGALVVDFKLAPGLVTTHFLVGVVYFGVAVVLHHRAAVPDDTSGATRMVSTEHVILARLLGVAAAVVVALGTVVTSTGPHGGAPDAPRFALSLHNVAQLHGLSVEVFLAFTILTLWSMGRARVPASVMRRGEVLLVVLVLQGGVGYAQYLTGVPAVLVGIHVAGAVMVVAAVLHFNLGLYRYGVRRGERPALAVATTPDLTPTPA